MCLDLLRPTEPCLIMLLGVVLLLVVPNDETIWIQSLSSLKESDGLTETSYIGAFLSH
jgi:hypothetical protein